jgi:Lar family restriction alleviation protein
MTDRKLKGCPFCCSRQVATKEILDRHGNQWLVACLDCGGEGPPGDDTDAAIALWNNRPCEL